MYLHFLIYECPINSDIIIAYKEKSNLYDLNVFVLLYTKKKKKFVLLRKLQECTKMYMSCMKKSNYSSVSLDHLCFSLNFVLRDIFNFLVFF